MTAHDSVFQDFIRQHINATADSTELKAIHDMGVLHCPPGLDSLCWFLAAAADTALYKARHPPATMRY
jgi:PleD family two-component response regulator